MLAGKGATAIGVAEMTRQFAPPTSSSACCKPNVCMPCRPIVARILLELHEVEVHVARTP